MTDASLGTAVLRTKLDTTGLKTGLNTAKGETQKFAADSTSTIKGIGAAFGAIAASQGLRSYISFMRSAASEAHQATTATALYEKALKRNNLSVDEGRRLVERLADKFGVVNSVVEESATFLLRQGASLDTVEKALTTAGASAAAAGFDISTAFNNVSTAVATGNSALLKTSGIVTTLGAAEQSYAKSIGKTVEALTQEERIQARVNAIYAETASEIEDIDILLQGLPKSQANVTKEVTTFRQTAGDLALKVLVPVNDALAAGLRLFNGLPEPVKQGGIAMAGAAIGATALATGFVAIRTALTGLSGLGLLSFGPAGWIVLGVTAVAGLVAVLASPRKDSLTTAIDDARSKLASGNADSMVGALEDVITKVDGPVKTSLLDLQAELRTTGEVGVEMAGRISEALNAAVIAQAQAVVDMAKNELELVRTIAVQGAQAATPAELEGPLRDRIARFGRADLAESLFFDVAAGKFKLPADSRVGMGRFDYEIVEAIAAANRQLATEVTEHAGAVAEATQRLETAQARLEALVNPAPKPEPTPTDAPGSPSKASERVAALRAELRFLQDEVDHGLAEAATLSERQFNAVDNAVRDLLRLGASESLINALLGERGVFEAQVRERAARIAPIIRAELFDESLRAEREGIETLSAEANQAARVAAQRRASERLAAVARAPLIRAQAWDESWFNERQEIEDLAIRSHNEARIAQQRRESEHLAAVARAPLIRAEAWDMSWFAERLKLEQMADDLAGQRAVRENRANRERQALFDRALQRYGTGSTGLAGTSAALRTGVTVRDDTAELADSLAGTVAGITAAFKAGEATIEDVEKAVQAWVTVMPQSTTAINELTEGVLALDRAARFVARASDAIQAFDEFPYRPGWNVNLPQAASDVAFNRGYSPFQERTRDLGMGDGGLAEARRINQEREASADRFANTVVSAGFAMGDAAIKAIADGDIPGLLRAGLSGAGSILGSANLGSVSFLGGSIGIGGLIAGGLGLLGTLIGVLAGGGGRDAEDRRRETQQARSVPAININFTVNQSNQYNGAPRDPANEQAFARQADALFESIYRRHLGPRLDRIEQRLGIAGAGA